MLSLSLLLFLLFIEIIVKSWMNEILAEFILLKRRILIY